MGQIQQVANTVIADKRLPIALTVVGCAGVILTAVMAVRATPKAKEILDKLKYDHEQEEDVRDHIPPLEVVKHTWKLYAPAVGVGAITIASIISMNRVNERNLMIVTTGAAIATNTLKDYQQHVLEEIGADKESKIRNKIAKNAIAKAEPVSEVLMLAEGGETLVFESLTGRYFRKNLEDIREIENTLNKELINHTTISLNDVYFALGLEEVDVGNMLGFNIDNMVDFHYSADLDKGKTPVLVLSFINPPVANYKGGY